MDERILVAILMVACLFLGLFLGAIGAQDHYHDKCRVEQEMYFLWANVR
ncbi:hypothetical protein LCGC14_2235190 [marine sediment metagenome]|uniref:Uncharacterized protein n=1 Tax=marine sediment metagenome TaxID=412755 RepID=A0A0F9DUM4_9ZZZZ